MCFNRSTLNAHFRIDAIKRRKNIVRQASTLCLKCEFEIVECCLIKKKVGKQNKKDNNVPLFIAMKGHTPSDLFI